MVKAIFDRLAPFYYNAVITLGYSLLSKNGGTTMPQEITRTQIEKYTVYTGPTAPVCV